MNTGFTLKDLEDFIKEMEKPREPQPIIYPSLCILALTEKGLIALSEDIDSGKVQLSPTGSKSIELIHKHLLKNGFIETEKGYIHKSKCDEK
jgi:hypothetical protein